MKSGEHSSSPEREACAGQWLEAIDPQDAVLLLMPSAQAREGRSVHFCNAFTLSLAHGDKRYREVLRRGTLRLPDGQSVVWARRILSRRSRLRKIPGPDLFEAAFAASTSEGPSHFLLGGDEHTLARLCSELTRRYPQALLVGAESPPFRQLTASEVAAQDRRIAASGADIVWVGLGTPKQDYEARRIADALPVTAVAIGAAFDFAAGTKRRAPVWMRTAGLEWVHRLISEPRRLWRRYLIGNLVFVWAAWRRRTSMD